MRLYVWLTFAVLMLVLLAVVVGTVGQGVSGIYANGKAAGIAEVEAKHSAAQLKVSEQLRAEQAALQTRLTTVAEQATNTQAQLANTAGELSQEFTRYARTRADAPCLDADGLRLLRAADAATALPTAASEPHSSLPAAAAAGRAQPQRGGAAGAGKEPPLSPVRSQGGSAGAMGKSLRQPFIRADPVAASPKPKP